MKPVILQLSCTNQKQANVVTSKLLAKKLVACVKQLPITSTYWWKGKLEKANEILLLIETKEANFDAIEKEVKKWHNYKQIALLQIPIEKSSAGVLEWLGESMPSDQSNSKSS